MVAVDLRDDWAAALQAAGFDSQAVTVWSTEGLLVSLPEGRTRTRMSCSVTSLL